MIRVIGRYLSLLVPQYGKGNQVIPAELPFFLEYPGEWNTPEYWNDLAKHFPQTHRVLGAIADLWPEELERRTKGENAKCTYSLQAPSSWTIGQPFLSVTMQCVGDTMRLVWKGRHVTDAEAVRALQWAASAKRIIDVTPVPLGRDGQVYDMINRGSYIPPERPVAQDPNMTITPTGVVFGAAA